VAGKFLANEDAAGLLKSGGVLILGTDTLPGFHCRADQSDPVRRIMELKGREPKKSLLVLAGSLAQASLVTGALDDRQTACCERCWPGPFSLILPSGGKLSRSVNAAGGTVAVRVPAPDSLRSLILAVGFPLVSTSVNVSGEAAVSDMKAAQKAFGAKVDGYWRPSETSGGASFEHSVKPSALIDLTIWPPVQLRSGPLPFPG
jgi:L-threonylcarbamoyladenylate synthase